MPLRGSRTALDAAGLLCNCRAHVRVMLCEADKLPREAMDFLGLITLNPLRTHLQARDRSMKWMACWQQRCSSLGS